jgi:hypothetical protein
MSHHRFGTAADGVGDSPLAEDDEVNVLALERRGETYIFMWGDDQRDQLLRTLGRYASDPELSFTWHEAAVLNHTVREMGL